MDIIKETKLIGNYLISLRKDFHKHPELGMEEYRTSKRIKEELDKIGVKYEDGIKTEVVATIGSGEEKVIALRADMDALRIQENTGVRYESQNKGLMHACGHDPRMAASNKFTIKIIGKSGHAGKPHQCIDATVACAAIVMNLQSIVSREIDPLNSAVVTIGHIKSGETHNIISGEAMIQGTIRSFNATTTKHIQNSIKRIAYGTAVAYGATATVEYDISHHPAVINDPEVTKIALDAAKKIFNPNDLISVPRMMLGEDFSIYQKRIPGVFAFVGAGNEEIGRDYPNHNDKFNIDEKAILISTQLYVAFALEALKKENKKHILISKIKEEKWN